MRTRGVYGRPRLGAEAYGSQGSSLGAWLIGGLVVGGAVLWAKHQSDQIARLYATADLPYQSFPKSLRLRAGELSSAAGEKFQDLAHRLGTRKELKDGT